MPAGNVAFSAFDKWAELALIVVLGALFLWRLGRPRRRRSAFSHSLGNALEQLQTLARPKIEHAIEVKRRRETDEDGESGPDDPVAFYRRKIREVDQARSNPR